MNATMQRRGRNGWSVSVDGVNAVGLTRDEAVELIAGVEAAVAAVDRITSPRPGPDDITIGDTDDQGQP